MLHNTHFTTQEIINANLTWEFNNNPEDIYQSPIEIEGVHPEHALHEYKGLWGGWTFKSGDLEFNTASLGVKGIGYDSVVVFNQEGKGLLFHKNNEQHG